MITTLPNCNDYKHIGYKGAHDRSRKPRRRLRLGARHVEDGHEPGVEGWRARGQSECLFAADLGNVGTDPKLIRCTGLQVTRPILRIGIAINRLQENQVITQIAGTCAIECSIRQRGTQPWPAVRFGRPPPARYLFDDVGGKRKTPKLDFIHFRINLF